MGRRSAQTGRARLAVLGLAAAAALPSSGQAAEDPSLAGIETVVVIYAENRSFDNLYGFFPGANGLQGLSPDATQQRDRDGSVLRELPPIWTGLTARGVTPAVTEAQTAHLPNAPFAIDDPKGFNQPLTVASRDLVHKFYQNQMQINGGKNDRFAAFSDAGGLVMGHYDGSKLPLWQVAKRYVLADNFFMAAFGGSFLNHIWLACACTPFYPDADQKAGRDQISAVEADGVTLRLAPDTAASAIAGSPKYVKDGGLTPDFYAVNTMQPPYQPSAVKPPKDGDPRLADPASHSTLPPQTFPTIGDLLSAKGVSWAWYSGAWQAALDGQNSTPTPNFQYHHQPYNYFANFAPGTAERAEHIRDGGLSGATFLETVDAGALPQVSFYKPQGNLNEHPGYADAQSGNRHVADVVARLEKSPQWPRMLVVVTYDENGGLWDHVAPPKADRWGPGTRIPALIITPFAKKGVVDHTLYDTTSILRFIARRFDLPVLAGIKARDDAMAQAGTGRIGDLTAALELPVR
jgi:phospholipase C